MIAVIGTEIRELPVGIVMDNMAGGKAAVNMTCDMAEVLAAQLTATIRVVREQEKDRQMYDHLQNIGQTTATCAPCEKRDKCNYMDDPVMQAGDSCVLEK